MSAARLTQSCAGRLRAPYFFAGTSCADENASNSPVTGAAPAASSPARTPASTAALRASSWRDVSSGGALLIGDSSEGSLSVDLSTPPRSRRYTYGFAELASSTGTPNSAMCSFTTRSRSPPIPALTPLSSRVSRNSLASPGSIPANSGDVLATAAGPWKRSTASLLASTLAHARAIISRSKLAIARGVGAFSSHVANDQASNKAELAPIPLNGDIGCAASPMATTLDLALAPVGGGGGRSLSYSGPAHDSSQTASANIRAIGSCHPWVTDRTNSLTPPGPALGADAMDRACVSVTRTEICHIVRCDELEPSPRLSASFSSSSSSSSARATVGSSSSLGSFSSQPAPRPRAARPLLNGIVKILARSPSRV